MSRASSLGGVCAVLAAAVSCQSAECVYFNDCAAGEYCTPRGVCERAEPGERGPAVVPPRPPELPAYPRESRLLVRPEAGELVALLGPERAMVRVALDGPVLREVITLPGVPEKGRVLDDGNVLVLLRDKPEALVVEPGAEEPVRERYLLEAPATACAVRGDTFYFAFAATRRVVGVDRATHEILRSTRPRMVGVVTSMEVMGDELVVAQQGHEKVVQFNATSLEVLRVVSMLAVPAPVRRVGPITLSGADGEDINVPFEQLHPEFETLEVQVEYYGAPFVNVVTQEVEPSIKTAVGRLSFVAERAMRADAPTSREGLAPGRSPLLVAGVAVTENGNLQMALDRSTGDVFLYPRLADGSLSQTARGRLDGPVGSRDLALSPDGEVVFLLDPLEASLVALDIPAAALLARPPEDEAPVVGALRYRLPLLRPVRADNVRRGERLFIESSTKVSADANFACASCHVGGGDDGMAWGGKTTIPLFGRADTLPYHWNNEIESAADLNAITVQARMGGSGLSPAELDDLFAYIESIQAPAGLSPARDDVAWGAELFASPETGCVACHTGPALSDGNLHSLDGHAPAATPVLRGLPYSAPYMADRSARTLEDLMILWVRTDRMGFGSHLTDEEADAMLAYLRSL